MSQEGGPDLSSGKPVLTGALLSRYIPHGCSIHGVHCSQDTLGCLILCVKCKVLGVSSSELLEDGGLPGLLLLGQVFG